MKRCTARKTTRRYKPTASWDDVRCPPATATFSRRRLQKS